MIKKACHVSIVAIILLIMTACDADQINPFENQDSNGSNQEDATPAIGNETNEWELPDDILQKRDNGKAVHHLQQGLITLGYSIKETKEFDENTTWAVTDFQLQFEDLDNTGIYHEKTKERMIEVMKEKEDIEVGAGLPKPPTNEQDDSPKTIHNPYEILLIVNKQHALAEDYIPDDLVTPDVRFPFTEDLPKKQMRKVASNALEKMFKDADEAGVDLFAQSGYRSFDRQEAIFASNVSEHGEESANTFSAQPGESEHQSGLTMDITSPDIDYQLITQLEETDEGKWITQHASDFGFIIRYPEGKEEITGYQYEPWHLRFVGKKAAKQMTEEDLTLEEYLDVK